MTRMRHLQAVRALEAEATSVVLGALGSVLDGIAATFGAVVAAAGETAEGGAAVPAGEAVASLDETDDPDQVRGKIGETLRPAPYP